MYRRLPLEIRRLARQTYLLWKNNHQHPSLHFKNVHPKRFNIWSVRIGDNYRALALWETETVEWFWIGTHPEYEEILKNLKAATKMQRGK
jgi:hypothetical protein